MDELELIRQFRHEDATPSPAARQAARERLLALMAAAPYVDSSAGVRQPSNEDHAAGARRAVIPTAPGFRDHDIIYSYYRLKEAGYEVDVATADGAPVTGRYGVSVPLDSQARPCVPFEGLQVDAYDLVVLTGGQEAPDRLRQDRHILDFVSGMDAARKMVAGVGHGPWIMISAGVVRGRRVCAHPGLRDDLVNAGADVIDADVIVDDNIITCSDYGEVGAFMRVVAALTEPVSATA